MRLTPISPLPNKFQKRFGLDNTQQVFIGGKSQDLLVGVYKDDLFPKNRIFARYKKRNGQYCFTEFTKHKLPKTFVKDKLVYEGNLYEIENDLMFFVQTGDFINLKSGFRGNLGLGRTILNFKEEHEVEVMVLWKILGFHESYSNNIHILILEDGLLKGVVLDDKLVPKEKYGEIKFDIFDSASNFVITPNGIILYVNKKGELISL